MAPFGRGEGAAAPRTNWSGNYTYSTTRLHEPKTVDEVQQVVKSCQHLRALGSRHSFNGIADSKYDQISLKGLDTMTLDRSAHTVTVGGGVTYARLAPWLDGQGFAVHNLASLPGITVPGAIATATHGSGNKNGNLATAVSALEFVTANGNLVSLSRSQDGEKFRGAVVNLGALGVVTRVTLDVLPTFQVAQTVYEDLPFATLENHLEEIFADGYSVSLFTLLQSPPSRRWRFCCPAAPPLPLLHARLRKYAPSGASFPRHHCSHTSTQARAGGWVALQAYTPCLAAGVPVLGPACGGPPLAAGAPGRSALATAALASASLHMPAISHLITLYLNTIASLLSWSLLPFRQHQPAIGIPLPVCTAG